VERIFAHKILYRGVCYEKHVAELSADGSVRFFPFEHEIPFTRFYSGTVALSVSDGHFVVEQL
jgi:hypothetical protein